MINDTFNAKNTILDSDIRGTADLADRAIAQSDWAAAADLSFQVAAALNAGGLMVAKTESDFAQARSFYMQQAQFCATMEQNRLQREANQINSEAETSLRAMQARQTEIANELEDLPRQISSRIRSFG